MDISHYWSILVEKLTTWTEAAVAGLPNLVVAIAILAVFLVAAQLMKQVVRKVARKVSEAEAIARLMTTIAKYAVIIIGVVIALGVLGLQKTVFSLLAGAGILGLALGFAFQDLAANFIAGIAMGLRKPFDVGDVVKTNDEMGKVKEINLRNTVIESFSGQLVIVPNREVFENVLINYSAKGQRRVELAVGVSYDTDLEMATRVAKEAINSLDVLAKDKSVDVFAQEFGGSSIDFSVRYWIDYPEQASYPAAVHAGVVAIKKAFDEHGIDIPFPIRTLDFSLTEQSAGRMVVEQKLEEVGAAA